MSAGFFVFTLIGIPMLVLWVINFIRTVKAVQSKEYKIKTGIRVVGIFMPLVGIFMGLVK